MTPEKADQRRQRAFYTSWQCGSGSWKFNKNRLFHFQKAAWGNARRSSLFSQRICVDGNLQSGAVFAPVIIWLEYDFIENEWSIKEVEKKPTPVKGDAL